MRDFTAEAQASLKALFNYYCFISTVNGCSNKKKKRKEEAYPWKTGASSYT
jgi:hypothetical protein